MRTLPYRGNNLPLRHSKDKLHPAPLWSRCTASVLIIFQFFVTQSGPLIWAATSTDTGHPSPVYTQSPQTKANHIQLLKTKPDFSLHFSNAPTDKEISGILLYDEPLVLIGGATTPAENQDLANALVSYSKEKNKEDVSALTHFLSNYPQSAWKASILTNLGIIYRKYGYYSRALDAWEEAWNLSKGATDTTAHAVADRAVSELARLLSSLGRSESLKPLLIEINNRPMYGSAATVILNAKQGLAIMKMDPGISFKCGPYALENIEAQLHPKQPIDPAIFKAKSTAKGFSLDQLVQLSQIIKLNYQAAKRQTGAAIIVPSVVHWKSGHYAAILRQNGDSYLVKDPTFFQNEAILSKAALDDEASGYFLVPSGPLPIGWTAVDSNEAKTIWGRGVNGGLRSPAATKCGDATAGGGCGGPGMATYSIKLLLACLHLGDTPVGYTPPVGPSVYFSVSYNQDEASHTGAWIFSNLGNNWITNWMGCVQNAPTSAPVTGGTYTSFNISLPNGGYETYSPTPNPFTSTTGTYAGYYGIQLQGQAILYVKSSPDHSGQLQYERHMPDGSIQIFDSAADSQGNIFLTQIIDPQGNTVTLGYDTTTVSGLTCIRLRTITDAIGQVTNLYYNLSDTLKITRVTDPFGRTAVFSYTSSTPYQLIGITDVVGMTSQFTYASGTDNVTALTTPYGTTTFNATTSSDPSSLESNADRTLLITDPNGGQEKAFARFEPAQLDDAVSEPMPNSTTYPFTTSATGEWGLQHLNTYYWDKKAMLVAPNDLSQAHVYHWLLDPSTAGLGPVLYCEKAALESRIWYNSNNSYDYAYLGNSDQPTGIVRLLDDGTAQYYQYTYNSAGNVTKSIDPAGRTLSYDYDTTVTNNIDVTYVRQTQGTNNDVLLQMTYDSSYPLHRPKDVYDASGQKTHYTYNTQGQVTSVTDPYNEITTYTYHGVGGTGTGNYLTSKVGPAPSGTTGDSISYTYDTYGRVKTVTDSQGYYLKYDYDALNRVTVITYPDGTYEQFNYNKLDLEWHKDRLGHWTHNVHDALGHLISTTDPLGRTTAYQWCKCGALSSMTDGKGNTTKWDRDVQARVTAKTYPDGSQTQYVYENTTSRIKTVIDAKGQQTGYAYNGDNTLAEVDYNRAERATPSVKFTYDANYNRLTGMQDGSGSTSYSYNNYTNWSSWPPSSSTTGAGRLSGETGPLGSTAAIGYSYDKLGRSLGYTINTTANSYVPAYDSLGRVYTITNNLGTFTNTSFLGTTSRVTSMTYPSGTGVTQNNNYYTTSNPQDIERLQEIKYTKGSTAISKQDFSYDADGDITTWQQQSDASAVNSYGNTYDSANQLSEALLTNSGSTVHRYAYGYDPAGNRTSQQVDSTVGSASYNSLNQLQTTTGGGPMRFSGTVNQNSTVTLNGTPATQSSPTQFTGAVSTTTGTNVVTVVAKDTSGFATTNRFQVVTAPGNAQTLNYDLNGNETQDGGHTYEWDAANRLTAITYSPNGFRTEFSYDGLGRRVKIVEKAYNNITSTKQFIYVDSTIAEERDATGTNVTRRFYPQGEQIGSTNYYYTRDHLGSVRELLSSTGTIVSRLGYDPYGNATLVSGSIFPDFGYAGMYTHQPSKLNLTLYRAYDPTTARWLSRDPIAERGGINLYGYVGNDPIDYIDLLGLDQNTVTVSLGAGVRVSWGNNNGQSNINFAFGIGYALSYQHRDGNTDPNAPVHSSGCGSSTSSGFIVSVGAGAGKIQNAKLSGNLTIFAGTKGQGNVKSFDSELTATASAGVGSLNLAQGVATINEGIDNVKGGYLEPGPPGGSAGYGIGGGAFLGLSVGHTFGCQ